MNSRLSKTFSFGPPRRPTDGPRAIRAGRRRPAEAAALAVPAAVAAR